ncbi:MAG: GNAT family N-acetyltransferase [bacterium]|nr:GNAT family N-acetyltransferase [bacterium]
MKYRILSRAEIELLHELDRTEIVRNIHYLRDDRLVLVPEFHDIPDWSHKAKAGRIAQLQSVFDEGATFTGAFSDRKLVGMSVVDHNFVATGPRRLNLTGLWVSHEYRQQGIGKHLVTMAGDLCLARGAGILYISATPSENTIRFYFSLGCRHADPVDPDLLAKEPEDIHLELPLV